MKEKDCQRWRGLKKELKKETALSFLSVMHFASVPKKLAWFQVWLTNTNESLQ